MRYNIHYGSNGVSPSTGLFPVDYQIPHYRLNPNHFPGLASWDIVNDNVGTLLRRQFKTGPDKSTYDDRAWTERSMQDLVQSKFEFRFAEFGPGCGSGDHHERAIALPLPGEAYGFPAWHIINNSVSLETGLPLNLQDVTSCNSMYYRLKHHAHTLEVKVQPNPFDHGFSLWSLLVDIFELKALQRSFVNVAKGLFSKSKRISFRAVSNGHLAIQYGLKPTLQDIHEFMDLITKYYVHDKDQDRFGAVYTSHNDQVIISPSVNLPTATYRFTGLSGATCDLDVTVNHGPVVLSETTKYYFIAPVLADTLATIRLLIDRLGLLDPTAAWDLLPFSFVCDWYIDVSAYLHSVRKLLVPIDLIVCDWGESLTRETRTNVIIKGHVATDKQIFDYDDELPYASGNLLELLTTQKARVRQFPRPVMIKPASFEKKRGLTVIRASLGSAIIHTNSDRKLPPILSTPFKRSLQGILSAARDLNPKYRLKTIIKILKGKPSNYRNRPVA